MAVSVKDVVKLYVAMFQRAPEGEAVDFWFSAAYTNDWDLPTLAKEMLKSAIELVTQNVTEYGDVYPQYLGLDLQNVSLEQATAIVDKIYQILFNKSAEDDPSGVNFWASQIASGADIGVVIDGMLKSAEDIYNDPDADPAAKAAATAFMNKVEAAEQISKTVKTFDGDFNKFKNWIANVTDDPATIDEAVNQASSSVGVTVNLTSNVETITGTDYNDTFIGTDSTSIGDTVDGKGGNDTFLYVDTGNTATTQLNSSLITLSNIEIIQGRGVGTAGIDIDSTGFTGINKVEILTSANDATVKAGSSTDVIVGNVSGNTTVDGGKDVSVTYENQGASTITINGSQNVSIDTTVSAAGTSGNITVGNTTAVTGNVNITAKAVYDPTGNITLGSISVTGGKEVTVNVSVDETKAATDNSSQTITVGSININGTADTTTVAIKQPKAQTGQNYSNQEGKFEIAKVTFSDITAGNSVTVGGLTFTAAKDLTAAEVAQAFANLKAGSDHGYAPVSWGTYSGTFSAEYTSSSAEGNVVTFTSVSKTNATDLTATGATVTKIQDGQLENIQEGKAAIIQGAVTVDGNNITTISIDGYAAGSSLGGTTSLTSLSELSLANSSGTITVNTGGAVTTLNLTVNNIQHGITFNNGPSTLNITTTGEDSAFAITDSSNSVENIAVSGSKHIDLTGSTLSNLKSITVSDSAGVTIDVSSIASFQTFDASSTSGNNNVTIDASAASYTGGSGEDIVTVSGNVGKAISLGDGDDTLRLQASAPTINKAVDGGAGIDAIFMDLTDAGSAAMEVAFANYISNFEVLGLKSYDADGDSSSTTTETVTINVDMSTLDNINSIIIEGIANTDSDSTAGDDLTVNINNLQSGANVTFVGEVSESAGDATTLNLNIANADTNTSDVMNLKVEADSNLTHNATISIADVETINLEAVDTDTDTSNNFIFSDLQLEGTTTLNVSGNVSTLGLTITSTTLTTINASSFTGNLNAEMSNDNGSITGGSGSDILVASGNQVTVNGGDGDDTLISEGDLVTLTGGSGADKFMVSVTTNVNSYAIITDFSKDDYIVFDADGDGNADNITFKSTPIVLGATAVFQDYANAAVNSIANGEATWFQYGGDTYIVYDAGANDSTAFVDGEDVIVKIVGLHDLSDGAAFNTDNDDVINIV